MFIRGRKFWLLLFFIGLFVLSGNMFSAEAKELDFPTNSTNREPTIMFDNLVCDLGVVEMYKSYRCKYLFRNIGNKTLKILKAHSTCGCSIPEIKDKSLEFDESGEILITFYPPKKEGKVQKEIKIFTNDPKNKLITLTIKATVECKVDFKPKQLSLFIKGEKTDNNKVVLTSKDHEKFSISKVVPSNDCVKPIYDPNSNLKHQISLETTTVKGNEQLHGNLEIYLTHSKCGIIKVPYTIIPEFDITPSLLTVKKKEKLHTITIINNYSEAFKIESVTSQKGLFTVDKLVKISNGIDLMLKYSTLDKFANFKYVYDTINIEISGGYNLKVGCLVFIKAEK